MQPAGQSEQRYSEATPSAKFTGRALVRDINPASTSVPPAEGDEAVLSRLLDSTSVGDRRAFAQVYQLTSGKLFAVALRILRRRALAEEVLQEAFLAIWKRADQRLPENNSPMAWMVTIVRNRAIDRLRAIRKEDLNTFDEAEEFVAAPGLDPDYALEADSMGDSIWTAIGKLPVNHRNAVLAAFYYGLTHEELAKRFDVPLGTAKSWVRRGLNQIKHHLKE